MKEDVSLNNTEIDDNYFMNNLMTAGSVDTVFEKMLALVEKVRTFGTLINVSFDWMDSGDRQVWTENMAMFHYELLPRLNKAFSN